MSRSFVSKYSSELKNNSTLPNPDLLVKNLRLLDFDEDFDWPEIDVNTFAARDSTDNLDRRLHCATWIFYKLFELYDDEETKRNLRELFPPIGLEQSNLLRNAIFKWLYKLKVAGFFGKEVVVRKAMFDDCKGSKFEELLAVFSSAALIKVVEKDSRAKCIVQRSIGLAICPLDIQSLILSCQASLSKHLKRRAVLEKRWHKFGRTLQSQNELLEQRSQSIKPRSTPKRLSQKTLTNLHGFMSKHWTGDLKWIDVLLNSDQHHSTGDLLDLAFTDVWRHACNDTLYMIRPQQKESCVQSLENRLKEQKSRLDRWKAAQVILTNRQQKNYIADRSHAVLKDEPSVRKYSLRSHGAPLSAASLSSASNPRKVSATVDDPDLPRGITQRETRHRSSKSVSSALLQADVSVLTATSTIQKPTANTGIRLSSAMQSLSFQDHPHGFPVIPITSQQSPENTPIRKHQDNSTISDNNETTSEATIYDPYTHLSYRPSLSLAERTKLSMSKTADNYAPPAHDTFYSTEPTPRPSTLSDLAQRTKQSMLARQPNRPAKPPRTSSARSANQFEARKVLTTEDSFFDEATINLDEVDIFKSRPRVAVSPVLTPMIGSVSLPVIPSDDSYEDDFS